MSVNGLAQVRLTTMIECIKALHLSTYVETDFAHYGGLMLVGPPGVLKTTILQPLEVYETVMTHSDLNVQGLMTIVKRHLCAGTTKTLVLPEVQRLYERDQRTSSGVEGTLRSLVDEGFSGSQFEDPTAVRFKARAVVMGAMTSKFKDDHWDKWEDSGFARRFIWCLIRLKDPEILMNAVETGKRAEPTEEIVGMPAPSGKIPGLLASERRDLRPFLKRQPKPSNVQFEVLCRMMAVLKYFYAKPENRKAKRDAFERMEEFSGVLMDGAELAGLKVRKPE